MFVSAALLIGSAVHSQSVSTGGKLYDKWWSEAEVTAPDADQSLWATQSSNTRSGADSWRCKECHGWDYKGADGAYGSGSHTTGFAGVFATAVSLSEDELTAWLNGTANSDHDFSAMGDSQIPHIVRFLKEGLIEVAPFIDPETKAAIGGDQTHGAELFVSSCAFSACHGDDGRAINFHSPDDPEYVGTIAADNPWEFIHKVRFGNPGTAMPAAVDEGWTMADIIDLMAFAQTLPTGPDVPTAVEPIGWAVAKQAAAR